MTRTQFTTIIVLILVVACGLFYQNYKTYQRVLGLEAENSRLSYTLDETHDEAEQAHERADAAATHLGE